jgi:hypothetical protein
MQSPDADERGQYPGADDVAVEAEIRHASLTVWMGLLFAVGSACFAGASVVAQWGSAPVSTLAAVYFIGSLFFTTAAAMQFAQGGPGRRASLIQLAGTIFFNLSTLHSLQEVERVDLRVWTPDAFGSVCFLVSSAMAYALVARVWTRDWWIAALNLLGSVAFGVSAVASLVEPSTLEPVSAGISNIGTAAGGFCFLAGAVLLLPGD